MRLVLALFLIVAPVATSATTSAVRFVGTGSVTLSGDAPDLGLTGLPSGTTVTVTAHRASYDNTVLKSHADFVADRRGRVEMRRAAPVAGSYTGVDPAGLFWSMTKAGPVSDLPRDIVALQALVGGKLVADARLNLPRGRSDLVTTSVTSQPGAFVVAPPADGKRHGAVIVLGGSEGGDSTARDLGVRLASRGFVVLGFPYYSPGYGGPGIAGLPTAFADIPVDRLQAARDMLAARADVDPARIGVVGVSKGAEFALLAASRFDWLRAVVAIVPSDIVWEGWGKPLPAATLSSFAWDGKPLPFVPYDDIASEFAKAAQGKPMALRGPHVRGKVVNPASLSAARIPIERYKGALLLAGGGDDQVWPSFEMAAAVAATPRQGRTVLLNYPLAGHLLSGDGYASTAWTQGVGGTPAANAAAQLDLWPKTIAFLKRELGN